jgi:6-phosphofructo-2-kinase
VAQVTSILLNGAPAPMIDEPTALDLNAATTAPAAASSSTTKGSHDDGSLDHSAKFFDPKNEEASRIREQLAIETLDELLDFLLVDDGVVGILDATNSTIKRRELLFKRIKAREPKLGILILESVCNDPTVSFI